jgi:hypothetical protein
MAASLEGARPFYSGKDRPMERGLEPAFRIARLFKARIEDVFQP